MTKPKVVFDPYSEEYFNNPFEIYRRMREEAPLYYDEKEDFYALTRHEDVAAAFVRCLAAPYTGAKAYNLRGDVVGMPVFYQALCAADPRAADLITFGERQIAIAYDLDDAALQRDLGPVPRTPLVEGVRRTLEHFRRLHAEGRLDTADLDG